MSIIDRFFEVMDKLDANPYKLSKTLVGVKDVQSKLSQIKKGKVKNVSIEIISALCSAYPNAGSNYILTGIGDPIIKDNSGSVTVGRDNIGSVTGDSNIVNNNLSNVGNTRHYEVPKKGFLKIIHPDGSEEDIAGDAGLLEALNDCKILRLENDYLKGIVKDKDKMISLLEKSLKEK